MEQKASVTPISVRNECIKLHKSGMAPLEIYNTYYVEQFPEGFCPIKTLHVFRTKLCQWEKKEYPDDATLKAGTYEGFSAHGATVQVNANGEIVQAWVKQHVSEFDPDKFIAGVKKEVPKYEQQIKMTDGTRMLEIPLFDMHFGVSDFNHYESTLCDILDLIYSRKWDEIQIPFGQDFFHNDSLTKGVTSHGTVIEKIDLEQAVYDGKKFMFTLIDAAINRANKVKVFYTPGNHDKSTSWMFAQILLERYGEEVVDVSIKRRKCIKYGRNAIMVTHGDSKRATARNLANMFPLKFPTEFADSDIREIHCGHLHHESEGDIFGIMVRRLSTKTIEDDWSDDEDYIGAIKRFMVFEWDKTQLRSIHYI